MFKKTVNLPQWIVEEITLVSIDLNSANLQVDRMLMSESMDITGRNDITEIDMVISLLHNVTARLMGIKQKHLKEKGVKK